MGKWISTTCCACLASNAALMSKGFKHVLRSLHHFFRFAHAGLKPLHYPARGSLLHHDLGGHLGMNGAEVVIGSCLGELVGELLVRIQHLGLNGLVVADHGVRDVVMIGP